MTKIVHEHREIGIGDIHGVVNWVVDELSDLSDLTTKQSDLYKLAWIKNDGGGAAIYILSDVDESGDTWEFFSRLHAPYQQDWNQNNQNAPDYIQHRPTIPTRVGQLENDRNYISGISSNDVIAALGFTPANVSSLFDRDYNSLTNKPSLDFVKIDDSGSSSSRTYSSQKIEQRLSSVTGGAM